MQTLKDKKCGLMVISERVKEGNLYKPSVEEYYNIVTGIDSVDYPTSRAIRDKLRGLSYRSDSKFVSKRNKQLITKGLTKKVGIKTYYKKNETA